MIVLAIDKELSIGNIIIHYQDLYYYIVLVLGYMVMAKCIRKEWLIIERGHSEEWKDIKYRKLFVLNSDYRL